MEITERLAFEFKYSKIPQLIKSMQIALEDLKLNRIIVIYSGDVPIHLSKKMSYIGLKPFLDGGFFLKT